MSGIIAKPFNVVKFIDKKRMSNELSKDEIFSFVELVQQNLIPDYQVSAFLMAVSLNGMTDLETYYLTDAMLHSGQIYHLPDIGRTIIDKHSTGGIGDKVSLILLPILVACGLGVAKLSGRGLGYTGGTIDKLASIGVKTDLSYEAAIEQLKTEYIFIIQTNSDIAPVDKVFYTIRDVTGTVVSVPLIASSIMSKKLALKTDFIFLDIKYGTGSFCETIEDARKLALALKKIAEHAKVKLHLHLTSMQQPLGHGVGNAIELLEAYNFLNNEYTSEDLKELVLDFAVDILVDTNTYPNKEEAQRQIQLVLKHKEALSVATNWFKTQGADIEKWNNKTFFNPEYKLDVKSPIQGFFNIKSNNALGNLSNKLGAGRIKKDDVIDYHAGIWVHKKINDLVNVNDVIFSLYSSNPISEDLIAESLACIEIKNTKTVIDKLLIKYQEDE